MMQQAQKFWRVLGPPRIGRILRRVPLDRPLAVMHIPKTSGTALTEGLRDVLPTTAFIGGFDRSMFGGFDAFETLAPGLRPIVYPDGLPPGEGADLVAGHFAYSTLAKGRPNARFMTVLREPRSRLLSLWISRRAVWRERQALAEFLNYPEAGCQTDNIAVRMLLWPHPLIPDAGFIDIAADERLACEAAARLKSFAFADVIENPEFEENVRTLLTRPFVYRRVNETHVPPELRVPLQDELTPEALRLIDERSRLDRRLWLALAGERIPGVDGVALSEEVFRKSVARYTALMAPSNAAAPS